MAEHFIDTTVIAWAERIRPHLSRAVESIVSAGVEHFGFRIEGAGA